MDVIPASVFMFFISEPKDLLCDKNSSINEVIMNFLSIDCSTDSSSLFIKYENLVLKPLETFSEIIKYLNDLYGLPINDEKIKSSIENVKFTRLKSLEAEKGFNENPNQTSNKIFFREGKIDQWKK